MLSSRIIQRRILKLRPVDLLEETFYCYQWLRWPAFSIYLGRVEAPYFVQIDAVPFWIFNGLQIRDMQRTFWDRHKLQGKVYPRISKSESELFNCIPGIFGVPVESHILDTDSTDKIDGVTSFFKGARIDQRASF